MNPEVKTKWIEALRSGKYTQGRRRLRNGNDTRCCLGILCDLAVEAGVIHSPVLELDKDGGSCYRYNNSAQFPSVLVRSWAGLPEELTDQCVMWNDSAGLSFSQIADKLEAL